MATINVPDELSDADRAFLESVAVGLTTARRKYPPECKDSRLVAFTAEAGEAFHAVQRLIYGRGTVQELASELRQAASMACRMAVEGDPALFSPEIQAQFPCIVQPDPTIKPHQPGYHDTTPDAFEQPCCGNCEHFENEDVLGRGWCPRTKTNPSCGDHCPFHKFTLPD